MTYHRLIRLTLLLSLMLFPTLAHAAPNAEEASQTVTFPVDGDAPVSVSIINPMLSTYVKSDAESSDITVEITVGGEGVSQEDADAWLNDLNIMTDFTDNLLTVEIESAEDPDSYESALVEITVPSAINLSAETEFGAVLVENVDIAESLTITTQIGAVFLDGVTVGAGEHSIISDIGAILFQGVLTDGSLTIETEAGLVLVAPQEGSSFNLDVSAEIGTVSVEGVDLMNKEEDTGLLGIVTGIRGVVGTQDAPTGSLTASSSLGLITVVDEIEEEAIEDLDLDGFEGMQT